MINLANLTFSVLETGFVDKNLKIISNRLPMGFDTGLPFALPM